MASGQGLVDRGEQTELGSMLTAYSTILVIYVKGKMIKR